MKSISFVICLIMFCAFQWSTVNCRVAFSKGDITLPTEYNLEDRDDNKLMASKTEYIYNEKGEFEDSLFYYDKELKDCKLNIFSKKISCVFNDDEKEYSLIFDTKFESQCVLSEKTEFVKADLYALNTKKQYGKYSLFFIMKLKMMKL